jgi:alpha-glucan,water dikinase
VVGAKANNLAKLRNKLPEWIQVPASVALPFGTFEQVLAFGANSGAAARLRELQQELGRAEVRLRGGGFGVTAVEICASNWH